MSEQPETTQKNASVSGIDRLQRMMHTPEGLGGMIIGVLKYLLLLGTFYFLIVYLQTSAWQFIALTVVTAINAVLLFLAQYLWNTERRDAANTLFALTTLLGFGALELMVSNLTVYNLAGGLGAIILFVILTRPGRNTTWLLSSLGLILIAAIARFNLFQRYLFVDESIFQLNNLVNVAIIAVLLFMGYQLLDVFQRGNVTTRLFVGFVTAAIAPILILGLVTAFQTLNHTNEDIAERLTLQNAIAQRNLRVWTASVQEDLSGALSHSQQNLFYSYINAPGTIPNLDGAYNSLRQQLNDRVNNNQNIMALHLIDSIGRIIISTQPDLEGTIIDGEPYFINGQFDFYIQMPRYSTLERRVLTYAAMPLPQTINPENSANNGVIAAQLNESILFSVFNDLNQTNGTETLETYLVNLNKELISPSRYDEFDIGEALIETTASEILVSRRASGEGRYPAYHDGDLVFGNFVFLPDLRAGLISEQTQAEGYIPLAQLTLVNSLIAIFAGIAALVVGWTTTQNVSGPILNITNIAESLAEGDLSRHIEIDRQDELGTLATSLNSMTERTRKVLENLEKTVAERTSELEQRARYLQAAAEVGQAAAQFYNLDDLLTPVTHLISERFGFYHVGIFLIDDNREYAVLRAANSEGGYRMLMRGHRLRVGHEGMVGHVTSIGTARVQQSVEGDVIHFDNPDLPYTKSEMTLPLQTSGELLGALDVQSIEENAFSDEDVRVLQVLANQVALAINNARLFEQLQTSLEAERRVFGELSREAWINLLRGRQGLGFRVDESGIAPADSDLQPESRQAINERKTIQMAQGPAYGYQLFVPIKIHGDVVIGVLETNKPSESGPWLTQEIAIMESISEQLGIALENARLFDETQRLAFRERIAADVSGKVWSSSDIETILQTTVQELSRALNASQGRIRLRFPEGEGTEVDG